MRSVLAVLAGVALVNILTQLLEAMLIAAVAGGPVADAAALQQVRNRPPVLAGALVSSALVALLAGYTTARIAGHRERLHGGIAALVVTAALVRGVAAGESAELAPMWMRIALLAIVGPVMLAGASIRARVVGR